MTAPLYAAFHAHWAGYVAFQLMLGVAAPFVLAAASSRAAGRRAYLPTLLAGLVLLNCSRIVLTGFQLETLQAVAALLAASAIILALARWRSGLWFLAGVAGGIAGMPKPTGLAVVGAGFCTIVLFAHRVGLRRAAKSASAMAFGVLVVLAPCALWIAATSLRDEMPPLFRQIALYASATPWRAVFTAKTLAFLLLPLSPIVIRGTIDWWRARRVTLARSSFGDTDDPRVMFSGPIVCFAVVWLVFEIGGVIVQKRCYSYHFLVLAPPAALLFGLMPSISSTGTICAALAPVALISAAHSAPMYLHPARWNPAPISLYVRDHSGADDAVWADPSARLLIESDRLPGARLPHLFMFVNYDNAPLDYSRQLLEDFDQRQPKYLVFQIDHAAKLQRQIDETPGLVYSARRTQNFKTAWERINRYVADHYELEIEVDGKLVYRRKPGMMPRQ